MFIHVERNNNLKKKQVACFQYVGSKRLLADKIIAEFPKHKTFVEVFAGSAHIFFKKPESDVEVINDINNELITFYRVLQNHPDEFFKQFEWVPTSRSEWTKHHEMNPKYLTDIQRAVRFYYTIRNGFGGKVSQQSFGYCVSRPTSFNIEKLKSNLNDIKGRLSKVTIECLPYEYILHRYDRTETLFYLDPPYHNTENIYGKDIFSKDDFTKIANILSNIKGKFLLSINNTEFIKTTFKRFNVSELKTKYTLGGNGKVKEVTELLFRNF